MKDFFTTYGTALIAVLQALVTYVIWAMRKSFVSRAELAQLLDREEARDRRLHSVEVKLEHMPSSEDITNLRISIEKSCGDVRAFGERLTGADGFITRQERLLNTLLEHALEK